MSPQAQPGKEQERDSRIQTSESSASTARQRKEYMKLTAVFVEIPGGYMGYVEELPGANTEGTTLEETRENLMEAVQLILEVNRELTREAIAELSLSGQAVRREDLAVLAAA